MKIAFITPEAHPYIKTGGLADVSYSLPKALAQRGHEVILLMPRYYQIDQSKFGIKIFYSPLGVPLGFGEEWTAIFKSHYIPEFTTYFLEHNRYFGRNGLYDDGHNEYSDNAERFAFFSRGAIQALKALKFQPDIIHCNDWQCGLIPLFMKTHYLKDPFFKKTSTVMTIHNVGYQGVFPKDSIIWTQLGWELFTVDAVEYFDQINYLKAGIVFSDLLTTVSKKYSQEIQSEEFGYHLAPLFKNLKKKLFGITNGVDYEKWNPEKDTYIPENFSINNLSGKKACKLALQKKMNIEADNKIPLIGTISRLTYQKGIDILAQSIEELLPQLDFQFVILGSGDNGLIRWFENIRSRYPSRVGLYWGYNEELSHLIEAGSDIYIMPSRYEPCGLNQLYSMKYGTIPVVRATGGLDDTIENWNQKAETGNGFKFKDLNTGTLNKVLGKVIDKFQNKKEWLLIQKNAMKFSYSWKDAAVKYEKLYQKGLKSKID